MKQKDLATIIAVVVVSGIFSLVICSKFLITPASLQQSAEVVRPISSDFKLPDKTIFNSDAIDPTQLIQIGPNSNDQPFANQ